MAGGYQRSIRPRGGDPRRRRTWKQERIRRIAGSSRPQVIIITNEEDVSADWVVRELRSREIHYLRLNTEHLADSRFSARPHIGKIQVQIGDRVHDLSSAQGIWYRRPESPKNGLISALTPAEREVVKAQWRATIAGFRCLPIERWINQPSLNIGAESKMFQLRLARRVGFHVPDTLVTNSRQDAQTFLRSHLEGAVIKALHAPLVEDPNMPQFIFSRRLESELLDTADAMESAPFILQQEIRPKRDVRVTVIDGLALGAAVAEPIDDVDWRATEPRPDWVPFELPAEVSACCTALTRALGLRFGALDLLIDGSGDWLFLEINPNGEWGWLQKTCGIPIAGAIADALLRSDE